jgi:hypothetical protein
MKTITIKLTAPASGASEVASAEFEDSEISLLENYLSNTDKLLELSIVKEGIPTNINGKFTQGNEPLFDVKLPEEEKILSLLHRMRMFILNDQTASYNKITGIISKKFNNAIVRSIIKNQRAIYDGRNFQGTMQLKSNGKIINSEEILFLWLNSFEYHDDKDKKKQIEKLHKLLPFDVSKAIFLVLLTEKVKAILAIADLVALLIGKTNSIKTIA